MPRVKAPLRYFPLAFMLAFSAAAQSRFQGEEALSAFGPAVGTWKVSFERDSRGFRSSPETEVRKTSEGALAIVLPPGLDAVAGIGIAAGLINLSGYAEIHLWVSADSAVTAQPYSQSSGWAFRDGGDPDTLIPGDGRVVMLRVLRESMVDPTAVQAIGVQIRPGSGAGAKLRLLAVTAIPRIPAAQPRTLAVTGLAVPQSGKLHSVFSADFSLSRLYDNPYDPDQIDVQGHFLTPSGKEIVVPAFWFQEYQARAVNQNWEEYDPVGEPRWRIRYLPMETGQHSLRLSARDGSGNSEETGPYTFTVAADAAPGPVRRNPSSPVLLQYANGATYLPFGHNLGFEDGNPDLNGTAYYRSLLPAFADSGENWTRFWMTDFSRTALEWSSGHWSNFYQGLGIYSQRAAWRVDQFFEIALASGVQIQLVINDHGQVSTTADARWNGSGGTNTGNPYNSAFGGPVPQANPEQFFTNSDARAMFRRRLRYLVARWSAYPNLLAWELFNEVQWAGTSYRNMRSDASTRSAIILWHLEMADLLKTQDPFGHLVTTSSDDPSGAPGFDSIWKLASIDTIQSHHYVGPPSARDAYIRQYVAAAQQAYGKPVIVGEMGVKANLVPECKFDPQSFLTNPSVPPEERTAANRDHLIAGTTLRNGIWSAALTQSGAMNWWWGCYMADDPSRYRLPPDFPLHARLFPPLVSFIGGEDPGSSPLSNASLRTTGQILAYGLQGPSQALVWARDTRNAYGSGYGPAGTEARTTDGATVTLSGLDPGTYVLSIYDTYGNGDLIAQSDVKASGSTLDVALPSFLGDVAFKVGTGTEDTWGAVPRSTKSWITDGSSPDGGPVFYAAMRASAGFSDAVAGGVLTFSEGESPVWELTVPAVRSSRSFWTVAEIGAPPETGLALVNVGSAVASVVLAVYDDKGRQQASVPLTLAAGEHVSKFLVEWFGRELAPFRGALEVRSDQPLVALALRGTHNDLGQFIMTSIPVRADEVPAADQAGALPQVADGGGYQTEWLLLNPSDAPLAGRVSFRKSDGSAWMLTVQGAAVSEISYSIPAHGLVRWTTAGSARETSVGYCVLVPEAGQVAPAGGAVIRYLPGNRLRSETGVPFLAPSIDPGTFWEIGPDLDTGLALINTSGLEQSIDLLLFLRDGNEEVRQAQIKIPAGGHTARFITEIFSNLPAAGRGYLRAVSDRPFGLLPLRMRTTARGVLFSSLILGSLSGGADRILPQVVHGGGYRTQFIIANPGNLASGGRISFYNPDGKPARLLLRRP